MTTIKPPKRMYEWHNAIVELARPAANSLGELPAGTRGVVRKAGRGLDFKSDPCPHCGLRVNISAMRPDHFIIIELAPNEPVRGNG